MGGGEGYIKGSVVVLFVLEVYMQANHGYQIHGLAWRSYWGALHCVYNQKILESVYEPSSMIPGPLFIYQERLCPRVCMLVSKAIQCVFASKDCFGCGDVSVLKFLALSKRSSRVVCGVVLVYEA